MPDRSIFAGWAARLSCLAAALLLVPARPAAAADVVPIVGHADVAVMTFSPDARLLLTGGKDNALKLWDVATGRLLRTMIGHKAVTKDGSVDTGISALAVSLDGRRAATSAGDRTIVIWELESGRSVKTFPTGDRRIRALAFARDGERIVSGAAEPFEFGKGVDPTLRFWNLTTGEPVHAFGGQGREIGALVLPPDGEHVVASELGAGNAIRVWRLRDGALLRTLPRSGGAKLESCNDCGEAALALSIDATGSQVRALIPEGGRWAWRSWRYATGDLAVNLDAGPANAAQERVLAAGSAGVLMDPLGTENKKDGLELWRVAAGQINRRPIRWEGDVRYGSVGAVSTDATTVALAGGEVLTFWAGDGKAHRLDKPVSYDLLAFAHGTGDGFLSRSVRPEGGSYLTFWNLRTLAARVPTTWRFSDDSCERNEGATHHVQTGGTYSLDGRLHHFGLELFGGSVSIGTEAAATCATRFLHPWTDQVFLTVPAPDEAVIQVDRASPVKWFATSSLARHEVKLWDLQTFKATRTVRLEPPPRDKDSPDVALSQGGRWLAWASKRGIEVRDMSTDRQRTIADAEDFDLSTDDRLIVTSKAGRVVLRTLQNLAVTFDHQLTGFVFWRKPANPHDPRFMTNSIIKLRLARSYVVLDTKSRKHEEIGRSGTGYVQTRMLGEGLLALGATGFRGTYGQMRIIDAANGGLKKLYTIDTPYIDGISRSRDGSTIAVPSGMAVSLIDARTGRPRGELTGHLGVVLMTAFSPDDTRLLSGSADGSFRLWDLKTRQTIITMIASPDGRWLALTPEGFFAASSPAAADLQSIVTGFKSRGVDQVWQSLYNPDLVRAKLAGDEAEVKRAADVLALDKVLASGEPPALTIVSPRGAAASGSEVVDVEVKVEEQDGGTGRIEWRLNDMTVAVAQKPSGSGRSFALTRQIALDPGANTIEVVAYNGRNALASPPSRGTVAWTAPAARPLPVLHVLAIGIDSYSDAIFPPLKYARSDAEAVTRALREIGSDRSLYADVRVVQVPEARATRDGIAAAFREIAAGMHARDTFVFFAAAHGTSRDGRFYMIPYGFRSGPNALDETAVGQGQLQEWLANSIVAKRSLVLLDTCASGALVGGAQQSRIDGAASDAAIGRLHEAIGRPVLTAAATGKAAAEGYQGRGVFTFAVLEGLTRAGDADNNMVIELKELVGHVQARVPELAARVGGSGEVRGAMTRPADSTTAASPIFRQSARVGSRGDNFVIGKRLD